MLECDARGLLWGGWQHALFCPLVRGGRGFAAVRCFPGCSSPVDAQHGLQLLIGWWVRAVGAPFSPREKRAQLAIRLHGCEFPLWPLLLRLRS